MNEKVPLSVVIIAKNEAAQIKDCLESVTWAAEIIVVDGFSSDETVAITKRYTDKVFQREMDIEGRHRNWTYAQAGNQWVLSLDADERVSPELREEIRRILKGETRYNGFSIPLRNYIGDYWIKSGGWYPADKLRMFKKEAFKYEEVEVHPRAFLDGECGKLKGDIIHYSYRGFTDFLASLNYQTTMEARKWFNEKRKIGLFKCLRKAADRFLKCYILKRGYKDGFIGFMVAFFSSLYQLMSYAKYWEMKQTAKKGVTK